MDNHLKEEQIQSILEGDSADAECRAHLERCAECREKYQRFQVLYTLLDGLESLEPSPALEEKICAALFPKRSPIVRMIGRPLPAWARVAAVALLFTGSAAFYKALQTLHALGDNVVEWAVGSRPEIFHVFFRLFSILSSSLFGGFKDLAGVTDRLGRVAALAVQSPEIKIVLLASAGFLILLALGWGRRLLHSCSRGGYNGLFIA